MTVTRAMLAALAVQVALAGCGSSGETDKTAPFVGPWTVTTGSLNATCPALGTPFVQKLDGAQQTLTKTADGAVSMTILPGCNIILDVNGKVATLRATMPAQMCMFTFPVMGVNVPVMGSFTAGNFTIGESGTTASFNYMGSAAAQLLTCSVTGTGTSMKGAAPDAGAAPADTGAAPADTGTTPADTATTDTATAETAAPSDAGCLSDGPPCTGSPTDGP
jgi:hypothetical protein